MRTLVLILAVLCGTTSFAAEKSAEKNKDAKAIADADSKKDLVLEMEGVLYPKDQFPGECSELLRGAKCDAKPVGLMHLESKKEGNEVYSKTSFSDWEKLQVTEESWETNGHVRRVVIENTILQKIFELEVKNGKVYYKITDKTNGKVQTSDEDAEENLVVPSTIMRYIGGKLGDLAAGKEVKVKVGAIDRQEAFTFNLKKVRVEKTPSGDPIMVIALTANSIFVRSVVDPMYLYITKDGELSGFEGKSPLMRKEKDKYKDMIVRVGYQYKVDSLKPEFQAQLMSQTCTEELNKTGMTKCEIPGIPAATSSSSSSSAHE